MGKIYVLIDPITGEIKYVGKTTNDLIVRLIGHISEVSRNRMFIDKQQWIKFLLLQGYCPIIKLIEECPIKILSEREVYWINFYKKDFELLNIVFNNDEKLAEFRSHMKSIKIYQYDLEGNFIKEWESISEAGNFYNLDIGNICASAKNKRKISGGFQWKYYKATKVKEYTIDTFKKTVYQYNLDGELIAEFLSAREVPNVPFKLISKCCNNKLKSVYGFRYSFQKKENLGPLIRKLRKDKGIKKIKDIV